MTDVLTTILTAPAAILVRAMIIQVSPKVMCKTAKAAPAVTDRSIIRLSPIPATVLWIVAPWAVRPEQRPACRGQPPCMTIVRLARTWENTRPVRVAPYASMRNAPACGMPPAVQRIVRIIVTSAADKWLLFGRHACVFSPHVPVVVHFVENMRRSPPKYQSLVMGK